MRRKSLTQPVVERFQNAGPSDKHQSTSIEQKPEPYNTEIKGQIDHTNVNIKPTDEQPKSAENKQKAVNAKTVAKSQSDITG